MIYKLDAKDVGTAKEEVKEFVSEVGARLNTYFGSEYEITLGKDVEVEDNWTYDIKIRKGNKIGTSLSLNWKMEHFSELTIDASESTKIGNYLMYGIVFPFMFVGAYMGANHIAPLDFLPGYKLAGGLGGVIAFIPGMILMTIVKSMVLKKHKQENESLREKIINTVGNTFKKV